MKIRIDYRGNQLKQNSKDSEEAVGADGKWIQGVKKFNHFKSISIARASAIKIKLI